MLSVYRALVKKLFNLDKIIYKKSVENSLYRKPDKFWRFVWEDTEESARNIYLRTDTDYVTNPENVANIFQTYFRKCYSQEEFKRKSAICAIGCNDIFTFSEANINEIERQFKN